MVFGKGKLEGGKKRERGGKERITGAGKRPSLTIRRGRNWEKDLIRAQS